MANYYIKNGGDDAKSGLSDANAWETLSKVNTEWNNGTFNPDDSILFNKGDAWTGVGIVIKEGGSSGSPISLGSYGTGARPKITVDSGSGAGIFCDTSSIGYIDIEGFELTKDTATNISGIRFTDSGNYNDINIKDCVIYECWNGIYLQCIDTYVIEDCEVRDCDNSNIVIYGSATNAITNGIIRNNSVHQATSGDCITLHQDASSNDIGDNHYLYNNGCSAANENGIDITSGNNIILRDNYTYNNTDSGIYIGMGPTYVFVENHRSIKDSDIGIIFAVSSNVVVAKSTCYETGSYGLQIQAISACSGLRLANNVITGDATRVFDIANDNLTNIKMRNNVISTINDEPTQLVRFLNGATASNVSMDADNNCWWFPGGQNTDNKWYDTVESTYDFLEWQSTYSQDPNGLFTDPEFTLPEFKNFRLKSDSSLINAGGWLTTISSATGSGTSFVVADAKWFHDGFGLTTGSVIQLEGKTETVTVTDVDYGTDTITVGSSVSWTSGDGVAFEFNGTQPDVGAWEYEASTLTSKIKFMYDNLWDASGTTLTSNSEATGYPDTNTQHRWKTRCWHSTSDTAEWLKVDLGSAQDIKSFIINNHNLTGSAILKIQGNASDSWGSPSVDEILSITPDKIAKFWSANQSYRWWRIYLDDGTNSDAYVKIGHVFLGSYFGTSENYSERTVVFTDPSEVVESDGGQMSANEKTHYKTITYGFPSLTESEVETLEDIFDEVGISKGWYICQNANDADGAYTVTYYVRNTAAWSLRPLHASLDYEKVQITVKTLR